MLCYPDIDWLKEMGYGYRPHPNYERQWRWCCWDNCRRVKSLWEQRFKIVYSCICALFKMQFSPCSIQCFTLGWLRFISPPLQQHIQELVLLGISFRGKKKSSHLCSLRFQGTSKFWQMYLNQADSYGGETHCGERGPSASCNHT